MSQDETGTACVCIYKYIKKYATSLLIIHANYQHLFYDNLLLNNLIKLPSILKGEKKKEKLITTIKFENY